MDEFEEYEDDDFASDITEDDFEVDKSNKNVKLNTNNVIIAILIFIIIILLFIIFSRGKCEKCESGKNADAKEEANNKKENNNDELSDITKEEIANKLAILFSDGNYEYGNLIQNNDIENYVANIFEGTLDNESKSILIIRSLNSETIELDFDTAEFNKSTYKYLLKEDEGKSIVYDIEEFKSKYYEVFGEEPEINDITESCPSYYYESTQGIFVEKNGCSGTATLNTYVYIDDIIEDGNIVTINAYVGAHRSSNSGEYYYDDYEYPKVKNNKIEETTITSENKSNFTNYNFIFEKDSNGEYHYKSTEKTN